MFLRTMALTATTLTIFLALCGCTVDSAPGVALTADEAPTGDEPAPSVPNEDPPPVAAEEPDRTPPVVEELPVPVELPTLPSPEWPEAMCPGGELLVGDLPFSGVGDTSGPDATDDLTQTATGCKGLGPWTGNGRTEQVWRFIAPQDATYRLVLTSEAQSSHVVYVTRDCDCLDVTCLGGRHEDEALEVTLDGGEAYRVVVERDLQAGQYQLDIDYAPTPALGDRCAAPYEVAGVPFEHTASTVGFGNEHDCDSVSCDTISTCNGGWRAPDAAYRFVPSLTGSYAMKVTGPLVASMAVVTDCADIGTSCAAADVEGQGGDATPADVYVPLQAGTTYFIVVDGKGKGDAGEYTLHIDAPCLPQKRLRRRWLWRLLRLLPRRMERSRPTMRRPQRGAGQRLRVVVRRG